MEESEYKVVKLRRNRWVIRRYKGETVDPSFTCFVENDNGEIARQEAIKICAVLNADRSKVVLADGIFVDGD